MDYSELKSAVPDLEEPFLPPQASSSSSNRRRVRDSSTPSASSYASFTPINASGQKYYKAAADPHFLWEIDTNLLDDELDASDFELDSTTSGSFHDEFFDDDNDDDDIELDERSLPTLSHHISINTAASPSASSSAAPKSALSSSSSFFSRKKPTGSSRRVAFASMDSEGQELSTRNSNNNSGSSSKKGSRQPDDPPMRSRLISISEPKAPQFAVETSYRFLRHKWTVLLMLLLAVTLFLCWWFIKPAATQTWVYPIPNTLIEEWALPKALCPDGVPESIHRAYLTEWLTCVKKGLYWQAYVTIGVLLFALILLVKNQAPDLVLLSSTIILLLFGIISPTDAWVGFSNTGILAVGVLSIIARGLEEAGSLEIVLKSVVGRSNSLFVSQMRLLLPVAFLSAFMNNTPVVAIMIPLIVHWSKQIHLSKSKFLMPLSFASMLGGSCTLIGTSTNLVMQGVLKTTDPKHLFSMFELAPVAVPCALVGILYMALFSRFLLPNHPGYKPPTTEIVLSPTLSAATPASPSVRPASSSPSVRPVSSSSPALSSASSASAASLQSSSPSLSSSVSVSSSTPLLRAVSSSSSSPLLPPSAVSSSSSSSSASTSTASPLVPYRTISLTNTLPASSTPRLHASSPLATAVSGSSSSAASSTPRLSSRSTRSQPARASPFSLPASSASSVTSMQPLALSPSPLSALPPSASFAQINPRPSPSHSSSSSSSTSTSTALPSSSVLLDVSSSDDSASLPSNPSPSSSSVDIAALVSRAVRNTLEDETSRDDDGDGDGDGDGGGGGDGSSRSGARSTGGGNEQARQRAQRMRAREQMQRQFGYQSVSREHALRHRFSHYGLLNQPAMGDYEEEENELDHANDGVDAEGGVRVPGATKEAKKYYVEKAYERRYVVAFRVGRRELGHSLIGRTLDYAGVLTIHGATLRRIERDGRVLWLNGINQQTPHKRTRLVEGDRLIFTALPDSIVNIRKIRGLVPDNEEVPKLGRHRRYRRLVEVVLSPSCTLVGRPMGNCGILDEFSAAIVAVRTTHASQLHLQQKQQQQQQQQQQQGTEMGRVFSSPNSSSSSSSSSGGSVFSFRTNVSSLWSMLNADEDWTSVVSDPDYELRVGDSLLLETFPDFITLHRNNAMFALVREVEGSKPPRTQTAMDKFRVVFSFTSLLAMIAACGLGVDILTASVCMVAGLIATRCLTVDEAFRSIKGRVLLATVASFGLGSAMNNTGVAESIGDALARLANTALGPVGVLAALFLLVSLLSCVISNNATVVLFFGVCYHAQALMPEVPIKQFLVVTMMGASSSFISPVSYQTQLMVFGPGSYTFSDYVRFGAGLQLVMMVACVVLTRYLIVDPHAT